MFTLTIVKQIVNRVREQDEMMMRNENFVRLNFRPLPLQQIDPNPDETTDATAPEA